jgi:hypothetical protein
MRPVEPKRCNSLVAWLDGRRRTAGVTDRPNRDTESTAKRDPCEIQVRRRRPAGVSGIDVEVPGSLTARLDAAFRVSGIGWAAAAAIA